MSVEKYRKILSLTAMGCGPWEAAGANLIDKIIHPADTRKEIIQALGRARGASGEQGRSRRLLAGWPRMF
ncbi:MAG: hypothetical protein WA081_23145 [Desulfosalsimonadaceae bacterium]